MIVAIGFFNRVYIREPGDIMKVSWNDYGPYKEFRIVSHRAYTHARVIKTKSGLTLGIG